MERLLSLKEVSTILGYTTDPKCRFVRDLRKSGKLPGVKIGNRLMFREEDVKNYINWEFQRQNN